MVFSHVQIYAVIIGEMLSKKNISSDFCVQPDISTPQLVYVFPLCIQCNVCFPTDVVIPESPEAYVSLTEQILRASKGRPPEATACRGAGSQFTSPHNRPLAHMPLHTLSDWLQVPVENSIHSSAEQVKALKMISEWRVQSCVWTWSVFLTANLLTFSFQSPESDFRNNSSF